ncbi:MAG: thiamine pyrophosphate-dependent enzyme [Rikenellaceae bacterium]
MSEIKFNAEDVVYTRPTLITDKAMHYCPGCSHGTIHKAVAEAIDELGVADRAVGVSPVGCSVFAYDYINTDWIQSAHGRACAVATGARRVLPDSLVFTYQGDGDLAAIGIAETIHAAARGENIVVIYVNNAIYGMTGGQMAPTTLMGMKTATTPEGRRADINGYPFKVADMIAQLDGATYITRQNVHTPTALRKCKAAIKKAFQNALDCNGFSLVEIVGTCSSGWKTTPTGANKWLEENMLPFYPVGDIKYDKLK